MPKRFAFALILVLLLLTAAPLDPAQAGGKPWSVWLYNRGTGELLRVYLDGTQEEVAFSAPEGYTLGSMTFSPDGTRMAACFFPIGVRSHDQTLVTIYDAAHNSNLTTLELNGSSFCYAQTGAFDDSGALFAFIQMPAYPALPDWLLNVLDVTSGEILYSIDASAEGFSGAVCIPQVERVQPGEILLRSGVCAAADETVELYAGYPGNRVQLLDVSPHTLTQIRRLSNGDAGWVANDPAYSGDGANVVQFLPGTAEDGVRVIFHDPNFNPHDVVFIDSGRKVGIIGRDITTDQSTLRYVDRTGTVGILEKGIGQTVVPAPMGYLACGDNAAGEFEIQSVVFDKQGKLQPAETIWSDATDTDWVVVWHEPVPLPDTLEPFPAINP